MVYMLDHAGTSVHDAAPELKVTQGTLQRWIHRYNASGITGLSDAPGRGGRANYSEEDAAYVLKTARTKPSDLDLPFR
ncbi:MAG: helix-turn-helix domain-containing protein [Candidatus Kapaibacterium sp.]|nr:MAG: helix-turn-helix domain-containing protein [Candidatus Kapabacteria bacterium]